MRRILVFLVAGMLAASLAAPAAVMAGPFGPTYLVPKPNGVNDTSAIQKGLDWCVAHGPNCTVQLQGGTYLSSQLLESNFNGTFKGMGEGGTTIQALPNLLVNETDPWVAGECAPNLSNCRYPWFVTFVNGNVEVSDLALDFLATNGTETMQWTLGGYPVNGLFGALEFTGYGSATASVDRVSVTGTAYTVPTAVPNSIEGLGFNVVNGIVFDGYYPTAPFPSMTYAIRSGTFAVRNSSVRTVFEGVVDSGTFTSSQFTIGGSPWAGNRINDVDFGIDVGAANSTFDISDNTIAADNASTVQLDHAGVFVEPSNFANLVSRLSQVSIHDNTVRVSDACGCEMIGVWLLDAIGIPHWFRATVANNTISLPSTYVLSGEWKEGIELNNTTGTVVSGNTVNGPSTGAGDAIGIFGNLSTWLPATNNVVIGNNVSGLTPTGTQVNTYYPGLGLSQYYLDAYTNHNLVVCTRRADTAIDLGTANAVIGCTPVPVPAVASGVTPNVSSASPIGRFKLPRLHP
ncbi:MAG: hypothetical protein ACLQBX_07920 [Candidatus Limnocylindrales bacterium]